MTSNVIHPGPYPPLLPLPRPRERNFIIKKQKEEKFLCSVFSSLHPILLSSFFPNSCSNPHLPVFFSYLLPHLYPATLSD